VYYLLSRSGQIHDHIHDGENLTDFSETYYRFRASEKIAPTFPYSKVNRRVQITNDVMRCTGRFRKSVIRTNPTRLGPARRFYNIDFYNYSAEVFRVDTVSAPIRDALKSRNVRRFSKRPIRLNQFRRHSVGRNSRIPFPRRSGTVKIDEIGSA